MGGWRTRNWTPAPNLLDGPDFRGAPTVLNAADALSASAGAAALRSLTLLGLALLGGDAARAHDPPTGRGPSDVRAMFLRSPILRGAPRERGRFTDRTEPLALPFLIDGARRATRVPLHLLVHDWADAGETWRVDRVVVQHRGKTLAESAPAFECLGDPRFGQLQSDLERLPTPLSRMRRRQRWFSVAAATVFDAPRSAALLDALPARFAALDSGSESQPPPFAELRLDLDLADLFPAGAPTASVNPLLRFEVDLTRLPGGQRVTLRTDRLVSMQPAWPTPSPAFVERFGRPLRGDLHVHSSASEVSLNGGSLNAGSLNAGPPSEGPLRDRGFGDLVGSFSTSELDVLLHAFGLDFAVLCDGSPKLQGANATSGGERLLAWHGAAELPADFEAGRGRTAQAFGSALSIVQSPTLPDPRGAWTIAAAAAGFERGELHAIEIWSGDWQDGQADDVGFWVELLLAGHRIAAVSGSDTRDEPVAFGATHVLGADQAADPAALAAALSAGRCVLSNDDLLAFGVVRAEHFFGPGSSAPAGVEVELELHHALRGPTRIELYRGVAGEPTESLIHVFKALEGEDVVRLPLEPAPVNSYLRVYAAGADGLRRAYTNPIWFDAPEADSP